MNQGQLSLGIERPFRGGIGQALLAAVLFGISTPLLKGFVIELSPQVLAGLLYLGSGAGLGVILAGRSLTGRGTGEAPLTARDLPWLAGAVAAGGVVAPILLLVGLRHTPASSASLLLNLEGVFTALIAWIVFRENVDRRIAWGMVAIVLGGVLLSWRGTFALSGVGGSLAIGAACLCWAIDNNLTQRVSGSDPVRITALKGVIAGGVNLGIGLGVGGRWPGGDIVGLALGIGFASYGLSLVLYVLAMRSLGTARTAAYFSLAPFIGALVGLAVWGDAITPSLLAAGGLMVLGLWLHLSERHQHLHVHDPVRHNHRHVHDGHHQHAHGPGDLPGEPHSHEHTHERLEHSHRHYPDVHHRHRHG